MIRLVAGALMMVVTGCAGVPPAEAEEVPVHGAGKCDASKAQQLVGKVRSKALGADALRRTGARTLRWIAPGTAVTMDFREDRLNIKLDGRNKVVAITCG